MVTGAGEASAVAAGVVFCSAHAAHAQSALPGDPVRLSHAFLPTDPIFPGDPVHQIRAILPFLSGSGGGST
jgi:hypothetical protein